MHLRPFQLSTVDAIYKYIANNEDNPCAVLPTGTGKSFVLAQIADDVVTRWGGRVLVLAHVKELLEQNAEKIKLLAPGLDVGIYSAGLKRRDVSNSVIVAGIQSIYKKADELGLFNIIIVDEAHLIPASGDGRYREFLEAAKIVNPKVRVVGLTATPYRLKGGLICKPENILNHVCYEVGIKEMIVDGYLSKLKTRSGGIKADLKNLHVRAGEFVASEVESAMDKDGLVSSACAEIVELTKDRNSVLIFTSSIKHCEHVANQIAEKSSTECGMITGDTPSWERAELIARFKGELVDPDLFGEGKPRLKYLANVNVLTTGFDVTGVDCVVLLRPTASAGLYVQMVGRGTRIHDGKDNCLILDYGGNVLRHGPVDAIQIEEKTKGNGEAPAKECPKCYTLVHAAVAVCPECDYEFPPPESAGIDAKASGAGIISGEITDTELNISQVDYTVHTKRDADDSHPKTLRINYYYGLADSESEWVCPEHKGWARSRFEQWWAARSKFPPPQNASDAAYLATDGALADTNNITVRNVAGEKYSNIIAYDIGDIPNYSPERGWNDVSAEEEKNFADAWGNSPTSVFGEDDIPF